MRNPIAVELQRLADGVHPIDTRSESFIAEVNKKMKEWQAKAGETDERIRAQRRAIVELRILIRGGGLPQSQTRYGRAWESYAHDAALDFVRIASRRDIRPRRLLYEVVKDIPPWRLPGLGRRPRVEVLREAAQSLAWAVVPGLLVSDRGEFLRPVFETFRSGATVLRFLAEYVLVIPDQLIAIDTITDVTTLQVPVETLLAEYILGGGYHQYSNERLIDAPIFAG